MTPMPRQNIDLHNTPIREHPHSSDRVHNVLFDVFMTGRLSALLTPTLHFEGAPWWESDHGRNLSPGATLVTVTDLPGYLEAYMNPEHPEWKRHKVRQYPGFAADLRGISHVDAYLEQQFSAKARSALRGKIRKLERECEPNIQFYCGAIDAADYDRYMDGFYTMLHNRFKEKGVFNSNLLHWATYYRMFYPLILRKEACLMVIQDGDTPISYSLAFARNGVMFGYLQTFDPAYARYNLGDIAMYYKLQRSLGVGIQWYDFSKGENAFKNKWCNRTYPMEFWVCYRKDQWQTVLKARIQVWKLGLRQWLRDIGFLGKRFEFDRFFYKKLSKQLQGYSWRDHLAHGTDTDPKTS